MEGITFIKVKPSGNMVLIRHMDLPEKVGMIHMPSDYNSGEALRRCEVVAVGVDVAGDLDGGFDVVELVHDEGAAFGAGEDIDGGSVAFCAGPDGAGVALEDGGEGGFRAFHGSFT